MNNEQNNEEALEVLETLKAMRASLHMVYDKANSLKMLTSKEYNKLAFGLGDALQVIEDKIPPGQ